jgi:hypothetical protein
MESSAILVKEAAVAGDGHTPVARLAVALTTAKLILDCPRPVLKYDARILT